VQSPLFSALCRGVRSDLIVAHVRKVRLPPINTLTNTRPFLHVCCFKEWVFAHNGLVPDIMQGERESANSVCRPNGETDSEYAFCRLLGAIAQRFGDAAYGSYPAWFDTVAAVSELVASHGKFNFLMSEGEHLIAYGHDRLHYMEHGQGSGSETLPLAVTLVATEPLSADERWRPFAPGELRIYNRGRLIERIDTKLPLGDQNAEAAVLPGAVVEPAIALDGLISHEQATVAADEAFVF